MTGNIPKGFIRVSKKTIYEATVDETTSKRIDDLYFSKIEESNPDLCRLLDRMSERYSIMLLETIANGKYTVEHALRIAHTLGNRDCYNILLAQARKDAEKKGTIG